jgi:serine O-acetyltransferase
MIWLVFKKGLRIYKGSPIEKLYSKARSNASKGIFNQFLAQFQDTHIRRRFGCYLSVKATIGEGLRLKHPVGIVIGEGCQLGKNVTLYQNVTLGAARMGEGEKGLYPKVGDGTVIYAGAVVIGDIRIGKNVRIGANSVVLHDIPDNCSAVGIPAKIIAHR